MKVFFDTPVPGFQKELLDIFLIFVPQALLCSDKEIVDCQVRITETVKEEKRTCELWLTGAFAYAVKRNERSSKDAQEDKRLHKRLQKLSLYEALSQSTNQRPPWGALTGVRPTRLLYDLMPTQPSLELASERLQTVFDVSRRKAELLVRIVRVQQSLPQAKPHEVDVYLGVPFCTTRCRYCSFLSQEVGDGVLLPDYVDALCREIDGLIHLMTRYQLRVRAVYMGGGTPTSLLHEQLEKVLKAAAPLIKKAVEVTVEAGRPDSITEDKLRVLAKAGVTRISINPQTMFDQTLERMGRKHTKKQTEDAFHLARQLGFGNINMDLIAGLPGEDLSMFSRTLDWVLKLNPESVTVHSLAIKRSSQMHLKKEQTGDSALAEAMVEHAHEQLSALGFLPYYVYRQKHMAGNLENTGYTKPGCACLYNLGMMEEEITVLSAGAGAISKRVWPERQRILRAPNVKDVEQYICRVEEMLERKDALMQGVGKGVKPASSPAKQTDVLPLKLEDQA